MTRRPIQAGISISVEALQTGRLDQLVGVGAAADHARQDEIHLRLVAEHGALVLLQGAAGHVQVEDANEALSEES
ncbi:MAG: hypothetical protein R3D28_20185 [Geminicoccaceae bacterium]